MTGETTHRDGLRFVGLPDSGLSRWGPPKSFGFLRQVPWLPIADTELLHLSHFCPIGIVLGETGPSVVALMHGFWHPKGSVDAKGGWSAPYIPMALRSLPFRLSAAAGAVEIAPELIAPGEAVFALHDEDGAPGPEFAQALELLARVRRGASRLAEAAKVLLLAEVLVPLQPLREGGHADVWVVSREAVLALPPRKAAALTVLSNLGFELAGAALFSQRWLDRTRIEAGAARDLSDEVSLLPIVATIEDTVERLMVMDESELFSFEAFVAAETSTDG
ncbi:SapC family protein [Bosea thiooxidans]